MVAPIIPLNQTPIQQVPVGLPQVVVLAQSVPAGAVETQRPSPPPDSQKHRLRDEEKNRQNATPKSEGEDWNRVTMTLLPRVAP